jgi:hypothetical protein
MARDDRPDADDEPAVDFVVGADDAGRPGGARAEHATAGSAEPDGVQELAEPPGGLSRLPPWLRRRGPLAGAAVILIVLAFASRGFASGHHAASGSSAHPSTSYTAPVAPAPNSKRQAIEGTACQYRLQPVTVATLPRPVTAALDAALPGLEVLTTSTQLGRAARPGACVLHREIIASKSGAIIDIDVHSSGAGDRTGSGGGAGGSGENLYVDHVAGGRTVHITASEPHSASGKSPLTTTALIRLAADPRLVSA